MRFTLRGCSPARGLRACGALGAIVVGVSLCASGARAQQPDAQQVQAFPPVQQAAATEMPQQANLSAIEQLQRRLDQQALEIQQLQTQLNSGTPATAAGFVASPAAAAPAPDGCPCQNPLDLPMCQPAPAAPPCCSMIGNAPVPMHAYWDSGVWFASQNNEFKVHIGGRIQFDAFNDFDADKSVEFGHGGLGQFEESQGFRRDRVRMEGTIYDSVDFVWEYDFATAMNPKNFQAVQGTTLVAANGSSVFTGTGITDMNATLKYLPIIGNLTVGSFLAPFSFELGTSDRWMDFIERSAAFDSFVPATNFANYTLGMKAFDWTEDKTATYALALSMNNMWDGAFGFDFGDDYMATGRLTALPYYDESTSGRYLLHFGLDGCAEHCQADPLVAGAPDATQLRSRLATREYLSGLTQSIVSTGVIDGREQYTEGVECVAQAGPWDFETEGYASQVTDDNDAGGFGHDTLWFKGMYCQLMYMITGENRNYNRERGNFERVVPYEDYVRIPGSRTACGLGAWQVGVRYSYVDLDDDGVHGGIDNELTAGINWFLNPNLKFQFNYDYTFRDIEGANAPSSGSITGFGTRMDLDF